MKEQKQKQNKKEEKWTQKHRPYDSHQPPPPKKEKKKNEQDWGGIWFHFIYI